ncbi:WecB/TagA/CpsF family glycosyltransferase [Candidatus Marithrix sp. Canyon 246]|uniref:WecB/TagA/CpsF family glycosyltransferase n=1 Tax=Candidatus Marithrix sp. Canyon 246 TaxID=1827136 RepID=UPI00084A1466|nr:WecB/TagA/CpsF family glycosyltransferase [Candidatus Marithrix sp. Canyon 246]
MKPKRINILGTPVDCVTMSTALDYVEDIILKANKPSSILAINPEKIIKAKKEPLLLKSLKQAKLVIPDGVGVVWAARLLGLGKMKRVPGAELMPAICERAAQKGYKLFLFGGKAEVNARAVAVLRKQYPGIQIVGHHHGYVSKQEMPNLIEKINTSEAEVLFIALGSPTQELWMEQYFPKLKNIKVCQGVGGTFDVIAGTIRRAPLIFRQLSLEWLYRLISQPRRFFRQVALPKFVYKIFVCRLTQ